MFDYIFMPEMNIIRTVDHGIKHLEL
ncbi:uncharacterized protein METZ01_LOCUS139814 [marine metagenome]|uniref:Uncharacterized protein n=1 Tax=marine metagenome TaxID=408172 RepID=A0A381ZCK0_9ZZZZ